MDILLIVSSVLLTVLLGILLALCIIRYTEGPNWFAGRKNTVTDLSGNGRHLTQATFNAGMWDNKPQYKFTRSDNGTMRFECDEWPDVIGD